MFQLVILYKILSGSYGIGRLCPAQARSAPMSGVHKGRDQSGESPQWRAPGCPKGGIPPPLTPTRSRLTNIKTPRRDSPGTHRTVIGTTVE